MITDSRGVLLAKSDEPELATDSLGGVPLVAGALRGGTTTGFGVSRDSSLFQAVAVPIVIPGSAPVGVLVATRLIDSLFAADVKAATSAELVFYGRDSHGDLRVSASTIGRDSEVVAAAELMAQQPPGHNGVRPKLRIHGDDYFAEAASLATAGGDPIGGFVVLRPREAAPASLVDIGRSLAIAGVLGLLLSLAFAYFAARRITRPMRALAQAVQRAADGDYDPSSLDGASTRRRNRRVDVGIRIAARRSARQGAARRDARRKLGRRTAARTFRAKTRIEAAFDGSGLRRSARAPASIGIGSLLANRYLIETQLGSGGMGIVYLRDRPSARRDHRGESAAARGRRR